MTPEEENQNLIARMLKHVHFKPERYLKEADERIDKIKKSPVYHLRKILKRQEIV